jgi:hypothetical protein
MTCQIGHLTATGKITNQQALSSKSLMRQVHTTIG